MTTVLLIIMGILAGVLIATQQVVVAGFREAVGSVWWAGLISYIGGTFFMVGALVLARERVPPLAAFKSVPALSWAGGLLGGLYIAISLVLLPRFGVTIVLALIVVGQMTASLIFDRFSLFGIAQHAISPARLAGAVMLVGAVVLIKSG